MLDAKAKREIEKLTNELEERIDRALDSGELNHESYEKLMSYFVCFQIELSEMRAEK